MQSNFMLTRWRYNVVERWFVDLLRLGLRYWYLLSDTLVSSHISTEHEALLFCFFFKLKCGTLIRYLHCLISLWRYLSRENSRNLRLLLRAFVGHQTNSRTLKHLSSDWPIYAKNNNKMLTSSSDKVISICLLVYRNVFTMSVPFRGLKKSRARSKFVSPNGSVYLSLYGI